MQQIDESPRFHEGMTICQVESPFPNVRCWTCDSPNGKTILQNERANIESVLLTRVPEVLQKGERVNLIVVNDLVLVINAENEAGEMRPLFKYGLGTNVE